MVDSTTAGAFRENEGNGWKSSARWEQVEEERGERALAEVVEEATKQPGRLENSDERQECAAAYRAVQRRKRTRFAQEREHEREREQAWRDCLKPYRVTSSSPS